MVDVEQGSYVNGTDMVVHSQWKLSTFFYLTFFFRIGIDIEIFIEKKLVMTGAPTTGVYQNNTHIATK